ncbi:hypothetical protein HY469_03455 [Candidatus Roizmanbacteria bacterium]|nr:hypothetical protein [Candidatus Roizmanbacteria bacterium]
MTIGIEFTEQRFLRKPKITISRLNRGEIIEYEYPVKKEFYTLRTISGYAVLDDDTVRVTREVHPDDREAAEKDLRAMGLSLMSPDVFLGPSWGQVVLEREEINAANLQIPTKDGSLSSRVIWWEEEASII